MSLWALSGVAHGKSQVNGYLGYGPGGLGFGVDYEMKWDKRACWGAYLHNYSASDEAIGGMALGGFFRPGFRKAATNIMTLGVGIFNRETPLESESTFGPMMGFGITENSTSRSA